MTVELFLMLLSAFSIITGLIVEAIKKLLQEKEKHPYNVIAFVVALIVGGIGTLIYYQLSSIPFTTNNIIYAFLMGIASAIGAMVGFDKIKQAIGQIIK